MMRADFSIVCLLYLILGAWQATANAQRSVDADGKSTRSDLDHYALLQSPVHVSGDSGLFEETELEPAYSQRLMTHTDNAIDTVNRGTVARALNADIGFRNGVLPLGMAIALLLVIAWCLLHGSRNAGTAEQARSVGLFVQWCGVMQYSIIIPESLQLASAIGHDAAFSGMLVGLFWAALPAASLIVSLVLWLNPHALNKHSQGIIFLAQLLSLTGSCLFAHVAHQAALADSSARQHHKSLAIVVARVLSGLGHGVCVTLLQNIFAIFTEPQERPAQMVRFFFWSAMGTGLGPMLASGMLFLAPFGKRSESFKIIGLGQLLMSVVSITFASLLFPDLSGLKDSVGSDFEMSALPPRSKWLRCLILCGSIFRILLLMTSGAALEVATSMLLETKYEMGKRAIGLIISATFLCALPFKIVMDHGKGWLTETQWIRVLCGASAFGTCFLFRKSVWSLIFADVLIFPAVYLGDGAARGIMQNYVFTCGLLDQTGCQMWAILMSGIGAFFGAWMSRWIIHVNSDQVAYAILQSIMCIVSWILFEFAIVLPAGIVANEEKVIVRDHG